ncbi:MAG: RND family transporter [Bacteroides sp.]
MKIERINSWFLHRGEWIVRYRWWVLLLFVLLLTVGFYGLRYFKINDSWESYFLEDDPMLVKTDEFKSIFGNDSYALVLTECDDTFTPENLRLIRQLSNELLDSMTFADKITSLTDIEFMVGDSAGMEIEQIVPEEIPTDAEGLAAIKRKAYLKPNIASRLVSQDGHFTWIVLKLRPFPPDSVWKVPGKKVEAPDNLVGRELDHIIHKPEYAGLHPRGAGLPYLIFKKTLWASGELPLIMGLALLLAFAILVVATRSVRGVVVPIVTAISTVIISYGFIGFTSLTTDSAMIMIPVMLAFAIAIAYNLHVFSYFRRQMLIHGRRKQAVVETVGEMGWPVLFSALTTAAALLSFLAMPVVPLHFIGVATSLGVMLTFLIAITVMPVALSFGKDKAPNATVAKKQGHWLDRQLERLGVATLRHEKLIFSIFIALSVLLLVGAFRIEPAFDVERTMGRRVPYVKDLLEITDTELGAVYSYDLMVDFPTEGEAKRASALQRLDTVEHHALGYTLTRRTTSILNILKDLNQTLHDGDTAYYRIPDDDEEVAQLLLLYENAGGSEAENWMDYDYRRLRLQVDIRTYNSGEAEREMEDITATAKRIFPEADCTLVGSLPQFTTMQQYIIRGQVWSFLISLAIIGVLMMLVFGSVQIGLIGLIPNVAPGIVVAGLMGWLDFPLDMMTATIIPMILGLAVDDTIHFINHGHLEFDRQRDYRLAILRSFRVVGTPIVLTSLIIMSNFAVYTVSRATMVVHMGILAAAGILSALLADLFITPLLFRRFRLFGKEKRG